MTFESHNVDNVIFAIFGEVTGIPEILGLFTNVVWLDKWGTFVTLVPQSWVNLLIFCNKILAKYEQFAPPG